MKKSGYKEFKTKDGRAFGVLFNNYTTELFAETMGITTFTEAIDALKMPLDSEGSPILSFAYLRATRHFIGAAIKCWAIDAGREATLTFANEVELSEIIAELGVDVLMGAQDQSAIEPEPEAPGSDEKKPEGVK